MKISNLYLLLLATLVMVACDPNKDIYSQMDAKPTPVTAELNFTLTEDDYETAGQNFPTFSSEEDAKIGIPIILEANYPHLGKGSSAIVGYDLYQGSVKYSYDDWKANYGLPVDKPIPTYTVTQADYDEILGTPNYGNFDNAADINALLEYKYPDSYNNTGVSLTYDYYDGSTKTVTNNWSKHYGVWYIQSVLDSDAYAYMGRSYYFSNIDDAEYKVPVWLTNTQFPYAKVGDRHLVQYLYKDYNDDTNKKERLILHEFDGVAWAVISSVTSASLSLGHDGTTWVPDNTIKYTMNGDDYAFVIIEYADVNPTGVASMATYGNYDITIWLDEEIVNSIADVLMKNFASADEGQKYLVTYSVWTGSAGDEPTLHMIREGDTYVPIGE